MAAPAAVLLGRVMLEMWQGSGLKDFTPTKKLHDMQKKAGIQDSPELLRKAADYLENSYEYEAPAAPSPAD